MAKLTLAVLGLLLAAAAAAGQQQEQQQQPESETRVKRQYHALRSTGITKKPTNPWEFLSRSDDAVIQYDASGLGFQISNPASFQSFHLGPLPFQQHHAFAPLPYKPEPVAKPQPPYKPELVKYEKPYKPEPPKYEKPYKPEPSYKPEPPKYETPYKPEPPKYKPEPVVYHEPKPYQTNKYPADYAYDYYCPKVGGLESHCRLAKDCAVWFDLVSATPGTACKLPDGTPGTCCPALPYNGRGGVLKQARKEVKLYRNIDIYSLNAAARAGQFQMRLMDETEKLLRTNNITVRRSSSQYTHLLFFQTTDASRKISRGALTGVETTRELGKRFELNADEAGFGLAQFNLRDTILNDTCPSDPVCSEDIVHSPFRTADGSCNNLRRSSWGMSRTQFQRALVPVYADGVWQPRRAANGGELPSARLVSISIVPDIDAPHETDTLWVMQYGQFVDHDLTSTPVFRMNANGGGIQCCTEQGLFINDTELLHPECFNIEIPKDDPFFSKFGQRCMSFVRSTPAPRFDCSFGHGEQLNQITHLLDHSNVYGSDKEEADALRTFRGGQLKVTPRKGHHELDLLPPDNNPDMEMDCKLSKNFTGVEAPADIKCFKAGDSRSNEQPNLAVTHTIFMRQHNILAEQLAYLNPYWDDERIYQEARRILIAQMQHITYNEWLPIVIGRDKMQELGMLPLEYGFSEDYDRDVNPTILNAFATAAFRFGHTLIQGKMDLINHKRKKEAHILLRHHFFKSQVVYTPGNLDKFLIGLATQPIQEYDNYFTEEVTNHLFEEEGKGFGMDLVALNLQRGRDHGIPGYNAFRTLCGLPRAHHFKDLLDLIAPPIVDRFELLYDSVDDVDLFIGAISERPAPGALVGPTFQCIIADQFLRLKRGDRYFYDLADQAGSFTEAQLNEIRKISFARLICDTSLVYSTQPLVFKVDSALNPIVDCDSPAIPQMNLLPWKDSYEHEPYKKPYNQPTFKKY